MSAPDHRENKWTFVAEVEERSSQLEEAVRSSSVPVARQLLQTAADATNELLEYLRSPVIDQAIATFHDSASERAKAAVDLDKYLADAGLGHSEHAHWELHDNNWCVAAEVSYNDGEHVHSVSAHYDSHTGWGWGLC